jgi:hypothetical protein
MREFLVGLRDLCDTALATLPAAAPELPAALPAPVAEPSPRPPTPPAEPIYRSGVNKLLHEDDFSGVTSDAALMARYITQGGERGIHLDRTGGTNGSQALRIDWERQAQGTCQDDSHLIEKGWPGGEREVVLQWTARYQPGFIWDHVGRYLSCPRGNAKKLAFLWAANDSGRFMLICENHRLGIGSDQDHPLLAPNVGPEMTPERLGDGEWHRITLRVRQSSRLTTPDGAVWGWIDGVPRWAYDGIASHATGGWTLFKLPTTFNAGSPVAQREWIDSLRVWVP